MHAALGHILVTFAPAAQTILPPVSTDTIRAADKEGPTTDLLRGAVGDCCPTCQAPLAADQRYCIECGTRRGKPRFSVVAMVPGAAAAPPPDRPRHPSRLFSGGTSGGTLVAGVATLLIAMGVGVLIGHDSSSAPVRASSPEVITVNGSGAASNGTAATSGATSSTSGTTNASKTNGKAPKVHITAKSTKAAATAASKALGSSGNLSSNPTQKQGSACSGGAGCQSHKFTGNFFGQ